MARYLTLLTFAVAAGVLGARVWAFPPFEQRGGPALEFQGYWMGVDPADGGDARRSIILGANGKYALAGRDTVFHLCDGTEHGIGTFDDGEIVARDVMQSTNLRIVCFNNGASLVLHTRFELINRDLMIEHATLPDGTPLSPIVLHRVSQD
ncbi:MAG TPA: hypothetical protein VF424_06105 [Vicinamibacterales bacterium]